MRQDIKSEKKAVQRGLRAKHKALVLLAGLHTRWIRMARYEFQNFTLWQCGFQPRRIPRSLRSFFPTDPNQAIEALEQGL